MFLHEFQNKFTKYEIRIGSEFVTKGKNIFIYDYHNSAKVRNVFYFWLLPCFKKFLIFAEAEIPLLLTLPGI